MNAITVKRNSLIARIALFGRDPSEKELANFSTCDFLYGLGLAPIRVLGNVLFYLLYWSITILMFVVVNLVFCFFTAKYFPFPCFGWYRSADEVEPLRVPFLWLKNKPIRPVYVFLIASAVVGLIWLQRLFPEKNILNGQLLFESLCAGLGLTLFMGLGVLCVRGLMKLWEKLSPSVSTLITELHRSIKDKTCKPVQFID